MEPTPETPNSCTAMQPAHFDDSRSETGEFSAEDLALKERVQKKAGLIANRAFHLVNYKKVMVGSEVVDWMMLDNSTGAHLEKQLLTREECVAKLQLLIDAKLLHHVTDEHPFEDSMFYYRFYSDEKEEEDQSAATGGELAPSPEASIVATLREQPGLIADRKFHLVTYPKVMVGTEVVDCMMRAHPHLKREECVAKGQSLINAKLLHHVTDEHRFKDEALFYKLYSDEPADFVMTTSVDCLDKIDTTPAHMLLPTPPTAELKKLNIKKPTEFPAYDPNNMHL
jgi:hypothetical protein